MPSSPPRAGTSGSRYPVRLVIMLAGVSASVAAVPLPLAGADAEMEAARSAAFRESVAPFLETHCFGCHGAEKQKARVRFDQIEGFLEEESELWTTVHQVLAAGEMPPEDHDGPRPGAKAIARILDWIEGAQRATRAGRGTIRRLNRRELSAALRDLTGLAVDFAAGLPEDGRVDGFDTGAAALQDAADSIEQVLRVTRRAVDGIRFLEPPRGEPVVIDLGDERFKDARKAFGEFQERGLSSRGKDTVWIPGRGLALAPKWLGERDSFTLHAAPPADRSGILRVALAFSVFKPIPSVPDPHLAVEIGGRPLGYRPVTESADDPATVAFEVSIEDLALEKDGIEISIRNLVEMPYQIDGFPNDDRTKPEDGIPGGSGLWRPAYDRKKLPPGEQPVPFIILHRMAVDRDHVAAWPPAAWRDDEAKGPTADDTPESARRLLALWIERAWRRPVADDERAPFLELYEQLRADGLGFDDALRAAFQSVLMSGPFRFLASPGDPDPVVAGHALADRLAFMMIGDPPDAELRRLAREGRLRDPAVLDAQVDRLLDDPRSADGFFQPFVTQWLEMGQPITVVMDYFQRQDFRFGRYLKASMRAETVGYVRELVAANRPAAEFVLSDWTMMNDILARQYGYEGIEGGELRRVQLRPEDPRGGGLLGHAGIQSMLTWMGENWVIYRGAWTLRHILDDPPPPPPLEVPELDPSAGENHGKSFRELLVQHQTEENCAVCHRKMDPLGFAFQNFDLSGRWREVEHERYVRNELDGKIEWRGEGATRPVDASGRLPRGEEFASFAECRELIAAHYLEDLVRGLLERFVLYGTGRRPDVDDLASIDAVLDAHAADGFPMRAVLKALVRSPAFLERAAPR